MCPPNARITRVCRSDEVFFRFFLHLWGLTVVFGGFYLVFVLGGGRVDFIFHLVLSIAIGLTVSAGLCVGIWAAAGGWGPPAPWLFGLVGSCGGLLVGLITYTVLVIGEYNA
jgi:hypothetical protein